MQKFWPRRRTTKTCLTLVALSVAFQACAVGEDPLVTPDMSGPDFTQDMPGTPDFGQDMPADAAPDLDMAQDMNVPDLAPDAEMDAAPDLTEDAAPDASGCMPECGARSVCENNVCVDICQAAAAECGVAQYGGASADCGTCGVSEACVQNSCDNVCQAAGMSCGELVFDGQLVNCAPCAGYCNSGSCISGGIWGVVAGFSHTCAWNSNQRALCWGE